MTAEGFAMNDEESERPRKLVEDALVLLTYDGRATRANTSTRSTQLMTRGALTECCSE